MSTATKPTSSRRIPHGPRPPQPKHWAKQYRTEVAASCSTVLATLGSFPLDPVKTQMQSYRYKSATACTKNLYQKEGLRAFYRGVMAPLLSTTLVRTVSFSVYQQSKYTCSETIGRSTGGDEPLVIVNTPGSIPTIGTLTTFGVAGAIAGAVGSVVACPFELTKNFAQISMGSNDNPKFKVADDAVRKSYRELGTLKTAQNIIKHRGVLGLWSGFRFHFIRDTIGTAVYFMTYESCKQLLVKFQKRESPTAPTSVAIAGGISGLVAWSVTFPIDSVKTMYQRNCLVRTKGQEVPVPKIQWFSEKGYRGLGVTMIRSGITNAIFFSSFEYIKKYINSLDDPII
ncbi:hypothetical protein MMC25_001986 [Agyrium rufum]|nr:hypothetical protein [Agyrium rufum]